MSLFFRKCTYTLALKDKQYTSDIIPAGVDTHHSSCLASLVVVAGIQATLNALDSTIQL